MKIIDGILDISSLEREITATAGSCKAACIGLIYSDNISAGRKTLDAFLENYIKNGIEYAESLLKGNFAVYINDSVSKNNFFFTDKTGLFKSFISGNIISTNFRELCLNFDNLSPDKTGIIQFLHFGATFGDRTLVSDVKQISKSHIYSFKNGKIEISQKYSENKIIAPKNFIENFAKSISGEIVSADLTGGIDSRAIVCALKYFGVKFSVFTSGKETSNEVKISKIISDKMHLEHYFACHSADNVLNEIENIFFISPVPVDICTFHRAYQIDSYRKSRGITLAINGVGGELFKDILYFQEFPFYSSLKKNYKRLYRMRLESISFSSNILSGEYLVISKNLQGLIIDEIMKFEKRTNTETIDSIWKNWKIPAIAGNNTSFTSSCLFNSFSPFMESEMANYGIQLPLGKRMFDNWHRDFITGMYPEIAKIKTTQGITVSNKTADMLSDISTGIVNSEKRLARKFFNRFFKKTVFLDNPFDSRIYGIVSGSEIFKKNFEALKDISIINDRTDIKDIDDRVIGKLLYLGMFFDSLK